MELDVNEPVLIFDARTSEPVEMDLRSTRETGRPCQAQEVVYRFMAGNYPGFEKAARDLFSENAGRFREVTANWPVDVREHLYFLIGAVYVTHEEKDRIFLVQDYQ